MAARNAGGVGGVGVGVMRIGQTQRQGLIHHKPGFYGTRRGRSHRAGRCGGGPGPARQPRRLGLGGELDDLVRVGHGLDHPADPPACVAHRSKVAITRPYVCDRLRLQRIQELDEKLTKVDNREQRGYHIMATCVPTIWFMFWEFIRF